MGQLAGAEARQGGAGEAGGRASATLRGWSAAVTISCCAPAGKRNPSSPPGASTRPAGGREGLTSLGAHDEAQLAAAAAVAGSGGGGCTGSGGLQPFPARWQLPSLTGRECRSALPCAMAETCGRLGTAGKGGEWEVCISEVSSSIKPNSHRSPTGRPTCDTSSARCALRAALQERASCGAYQTAGEHGRCSRMGEDALGLPVEPPPPAAASGASR